MISSIDFLANNGDVGGGEVMLLAMAEAAAGVGVAVRVVGPDQPGELRQRAEAAGHTYVNVGGTTRRSYLSALARWRGRSDADLLWCNGLLPAVAFIGNRQRRVVHLHQLPTGRQRQLATFARWGAVEVVVPSSYMASQIPGSVVLENWSDDIEVYGEAEQHSPLRVGFIGRFSQMKGLDVFADAMSELQAADPGRFELVLAGDGRFVPANEIEAVEAALGRVPSVRRLGWVTRDDFFGAVDVVCVPSTYPESFGLVAAEALAARRVLVVSDSGALPEIVGPDHRWVVPPADSHALAQALHEVADVSPAEMSSLVERGRARWEQRFSPAAGHARMRDLLSGLGNAGVGVVAPRLESR